MPTENRSSNTDYPHLEAASSAMTQIRTMLGREQRPDQLAAALESCDWSDTPIGNKAIILSAIRALRTKQPHPEPIAWMVGTAFWWTKVEAERDAAATGLQVVGLGPMTDPGDVEQLREVIKHSDAQIMRQSMRISNQRAQLAELDALLRELLEYAELGWDFTPDIAVKVRAALSASAEPSAPTPMPEYMEAACDKFDWTPEEALRFYAEGKHFDVVAGRTRILCTGAIASHALKGLSAEYAGMKGAELEAKS
ncbi:hypothetical protein QTN23_26670 [Pseudomonas shirazica]|uniref:hypothetical protein n=1 Tax=Pseudomonas shirazica TaxID=1940636 RepID=UPI0025A9822C|nr:hypothetical protein [Pseudomonas shirazica]MDM9601389.1 hypothetical protein [Pseudomonas shirazica]MDM9601915.1 hypothetical protein [Pseudomonas shirazica]MDO2414774.1 hypothetical protein [Pseudomonas shirazica]MDO2416457.1 hypothetical protein [Pseudomonas shirazica]